MHHDHFVKPLIGFGVAHDAQVRGQACAGAQQVQVFSWQQVIDEQSAGGFATHDQGVAHLDVLQARGQRPIRHLDA